MSKEELLKILEQGVSVWNTWRENNPKVEIDLSNERLNRQSLRGINLKGANLESSKFFYSDLSGADLEETQLKGAYMAWANLSGANLRQAKMHRVNLWKATLTGANLTQAVMILANLQDANLADANLNEAILEGALLTSADFSRAKLTNCHVHGVSVWGATFKNAEQSNIFITPNTPDSRDSAITVDNIEVAQFIYLLLNNEKIRDVIDTIGKKGVLVLGRFTERKHILNEIKDKLRQLGYVPIVFDFERPTNRDFTETVMTLAGMCLFIIADITSPRAIQLELQATIPNYMIPFVPILQKGEEPFSMFRDLAIKYQDWVLPLLKYDSHSKLVERLEKAIVNPALKRRDELLMKKALELSSRDIDEYE